MLLFFGDGMCAGFPFQSSPTCYTGDMGYTSGAQPSGGDWDSLIFVTLTLMVWRLLFFILFFLLFIFFYYQVLKISCTYKMKKGPLVGKKETRALTSLRNAGAAGLEPCDVIMQSDSIDALRSR